MSHAILREHEVVPCDLMTWAKWLEEHDDDRIVAKAHIQGYLISTVFLGLDHNFGGDRPLWFETMIFREDDFHDLYCERYETWDEALEGHKRACESCRNLEVPE